MKKYINLALAGALALSLAACGSSNNSETTAATTAAAAEETKAQEESAASVETVELRLGHVTSPENPYAIAAAKVADEVYEKTNGAVKITIYPSNQLGNQRTMVENVQNGVQDIVMASPSTLSAFDKNAAICDIPFLFVSSEHAYKVLDDPDIRAGLFGNIEGSVGHIAAIYDQGWRQMFSKDRLFKKPEDCKGLKMRTMESTAFLEMAKAIGASAVPMSYSECYTALQQGVFDFMENTTSALYADGYSEIAPYVTLTYHTYAPSVVIISSVVEGKIGSENYKILCDSFAEYQDEARKISVEDDERVIGKMKEAGVNVYKLTDEERQAYIDACAPVFDAMRKETNGDLIDKILNYQY